MMNKLKTCWNLLKRAGLSWNQNDPWSQSATIAYYALFSLPSLLIIVVSITGYFYGHEAVQGRLTHEIGNYIGENAAHAIEKMISNVVLQNNSTFMLIIGIGVLLFGATGVFFHMKQALNNIWNVTAKKNSFLRMLINRAISFGMVLIIGFLLLIFLVSSTLLAAFGDYIASVIPSFSNLFAQLLNFFITFLFMSALFAFIFKLLPDVKLKWKTMYLGASLTTILFMIGTYLLSLYFEIGKPTSVFGGASAVVLILLWAYYSCLILFYGAEFSMQYALYKNENIIPNQYAEPAIYQQLERIKNKKGLWVDQERIIKMFRPESDNQDS